MTPINLMQALKARLEAVTKNYRYQQSDGEHTLKDITVHLQHLPEKMYVDETDPSDYPFILLILDGGQVSENSEATCSIGILAGAYDDGIEITGGVRDRQGWIIPAEIIWRVLSDLEQNPLIDMRYKIEKPVTWELPEEQPAPMWYGLITLSISIPIPQPEHGMDWWTTAPTMKNYQKLNTI